MKSNIAVVSLLTTLLYSLATSAPSVDIEKLVRVEKLGVAGTGNVCLYNDKPRSLSFEYKPFNGITNSQNGKAEFKILKSINDACNAFAMMGVESDPKKVVEEMVKLESGERTTYDKVLGYKQVSCGDILYGQKRLGEDFPGDIYLYFFKSKPTLSNWSSLIFQQIKFKGDCSETLNFGDQFGSGKLTCYRGKADNGVTEYCEPEHVVPAQPNVNDEDADESTGPEARPGDMIVFTSIITNPGTVPLCGIQLATSANVNIEDDNTPIYVSGDNGDGCIAPNNKEKWIYVQSNILEDSNEEIEVIYTDTVQAVTSEGIVVSDSDEVHYLQQPPLPPLPEKGLCDVCDKPMLMTWTYQPSNKLLGFQGTKAKVTGSKTDGRVFVVVADETDNNKLLGENPDANIYFRGYLNPGDVFQTKPNFLGVSGQTTDKFENDVYFMVFNTEVSVFYGTAPLQTATYHHSCAEPIIPGAVIGSFTLGTPYVGQDSCRYPVSIDFVLVNADTDKDIGTISSGDLILTDAVGSRLSIRAEAPGANSVQFYWNGVDGRSETRYESVEPFAMGSNSGGNYEAVNYLGVKGTKSITVTARSPKEFELSTETISFTVMEQTSRPTVSPTSSPTHVPTSAPTSNPTSMPTSTPTSNPTKSPTLNPTKSPTSKPTPIPTNTPTLARSETPTFASSVVPTSTPSAGPTSEPTLGPTTRPTSNPTNSPTTAPTELEETIDPNFECPFPVLGDAGWEATVKYPVDIAEAHGSMIGNDFVLISGFYQNFKNTTEKVYALDVANYDPMNKPAWRRMDDYPIWPAVSHAAIAVVGTKIYVVGGYRGAEPGKETALVFIYDHSIAPGTTGQWSSAPDMPDGRAGGAAFYDSLTNAIYHVSGAKRPGADQGIIYSVDYDDTWRLPLNSEGLPFDANGNPTVWETVASCPHKANHLGYGTAFDKNRNERHFVFGGQEGQNEKEGNFATNLEYIPEVDGPGTWVALQDMPEARGHSSSSTFAWGCGFITAGGALNADLQSDDVLYYDIPRDEWFKIGSITIPVNVPICGYNNGWMHCEIPFGWTTYRRQLTAGTFPPPTASPTSTPTTLVVPTSTPSAGPTSTPTVIPTEQPTNSPTDTPTTARSETPTFASTVVPTSTPSAGPTSAPTTGKSPTFAPTLALTSSPTPALPEFGIRINVGSSVGLTDSLDREWLPDTYFNRGFTESKTNEEVIGSNPADDPIYQTARFGNNYWYAIPLPEGNYAIKLHFMEFYRVNANERVFNLQVENTLLENFDVIRIGGGRLRAFTVDFVEIVDDGFLNIVVSPSELNQGGILNGIEVSLLEVHLAHAVSGGPYKVVDADNDGSAFVSVNGVGSHTHGDGLELVSSVWKEGGTVLGTALVTDFELPVGEHTVSLTVVDSGGNSDTHQTLISVKPFGYPDISVITPNTGGVAGFETLYIVGTGYTFPTNETIVRFAGVNLLDGDFEVVNSTHIKVFKTPTVVIARTVDVTVETPLGESDPSEYRYVASVPIAFTESLLCDLPFAARVKFGPDGHLYVATTTTSSIARYELLFNEDGTVSVENSVTSSLIGMGYPGKRFILGIAFDPMETDPRNDPDGEPWRPSVYITHSAIFHKDQRNSAGLGINGIVTKVTGESLDIFEDIITGMPVSDFDHALNDIVFGNYGELYFSIGGNTNGGLPGALSTSQTVGSSFFSGGIIKANLADPDFNGNVQYTTEIDGIPVVDGASPGDADYHGPDLFAYGLRNPFGLTIHSNGELYATDNGPNKGYGRMSTGCGDLDFIPDETTVDEVNHIVQGKYYGHPNRLRANYYNETEQCIWRSPRIASEGNYREPIATSPSSAGGITEYHANHFDRQLRGNLIVSDYKEALRRVVLTPAGDAAVVESAHSIKVSGDNGLDVTMAPNGWLFEARYSENQVWFQRPVESEAARSTLKINTVFPHRGPVTGGNVLSLYGYQFNQTTHIPVVTVGGSLCENARVVAYDRIDCILPPGTGLVDVVLSKGDKISTFTDGYRYITGVPLN